MIMDEIPTEKTEEQKQKDEEIKSLAWGLVCNLSAVQKCIELGRDDIAKGHFRQVVFAIAQLAPLVDDDAKVVMAEYDHRPDKE